MMVNKEFLEKKYIGFVSDTVCSSLETKKQIEDIILHEIDIMENNEKVTWSDVYDKTNKETRAIFNSIIEDRIIRVDKKICMASRPSFAVCTFINGVCERIEFYEGYNVLGKSYDLRSKRLKNEQLKNSYLGK